MSGAVIDTKLVSFWAMTAKTMWQPSQATQVFMDFSGRKIMEILPIMWITSMQGVSRYR